MDIHRCRFVPYPPSAINALAFSHISSPTSPGKGPSSLRLAIGRANGDIEIWNPLRGAWYQESILRGAKDRSIEGLVWTQDPEDVDKSSNIIAGKLRLFSIGYSTAVTEWNLGTGRPLRHSAGNYGEIWCMAAQPKGQVLKKPERAKGDETQGEESQIQDLAVGCADGAIVLLNTADGDLRFTRILARPSKKKSRVLSLTFQNRHTIIAGHADSTIRVYDMRNSQQVRNMTLGAGPKGGPKETLVWSVKSLLDGTIVSGDSTGTLCFWDGKNYALLQRIKSHDADILDVAVSTDGQSVFSGGMDRRTTLYKRTGNGRPGEGHRWVKIKHQRMHQNDVKVMATFETRGLSILVSGGLDTTPIIVPIQDFGREHHRALANLPQEPNVRSATNKRLLLDEDSSLHVDEPQGRRLVAKIALQGDEAITSADISSDGKKLAVATMAEIRVFGLRLKSGMLKVQKLEKIQTFADLSKRQAKMIQFSPDAKWLATIGADNVIQLYRRSEMENDKLSPVFLQKSVELKRLRRDTSGKKTKDASLGSYNRTINRLAFSADSRILAVSDISGFLDTWVVEGHEDLTQNAEETNPADAADKSNSSDDEDSDEENSRTTIFGEHWTRNPAASLLTKLPAAPLVLAFRPLTMQATGNLTNGNVGVHPTRHNPHPRSYDLPNGEDRLFVLTAENQIYEFNVLSGKMSDWSRRNPTSSLPREFRDLKDRAKSAVWDVGGNNERIWLYGVSWLWMFDLSRDLRPVDDEQEDANVKNGISKEVSLKRKRGDNDEEIIASSLGIDTGVGGKIPNAELGTDTGHKMRKMNGADAAVDQRIILDAEQGVYSDDEGGYALANESNMALIKFRRGNTAVNGHIPNGHVDNATDAETSENDGARVAKMREGERPGYWHTYKYRPILGIVPLGNDTDDGTAVGGDGDDSSSGLEVALIERPLFDVDLPPRYFGNQEWNS
ncbi:MAG: U3 small nucleolar RNA-associated protein [Alectoria sarmentosa]|nr:MAG: U3 small nucleolar RNA-associated protein [Alectoria sarmentosa]